MFGEELSVYFVNPARDALGYEHVEGCLRFGRDEVELTFDEKDRAFRKIPAVTVTFGYGEVVKVTYVSRWFRPKQLRFETKTPEKLAEFPGAEVGQVALYIKPESREAASKAPALVEFMQSEAWLAESDERLRERRNDLESGS
ncbi:MAG: hypothetical protein KDN19_13845 [Verrucomicrobiae bacterium]|nr:hypothetical protein [Verrucomicrobiae bacterium]